MHLSSSSRGGGAHPWAVGGGTGDFVGNFAACLCPCDGGNKKGPCFIVV